MLDPLASRPATSEGLTLEESARALGHYRWLELRLFETLGGWAPTVPEVEVKLHLHTVAPEHAWHAELWREALPRPDGLDADALTVPAGGAVEAFMEALAAPSGRDQTVEKLVGVYRVLAPRQVGAYRRHLAQASQLSDGPVVRALGLVLRDEVDHWQEGELLVQSLVWSEDGARRAAAHQAHLEATLLAPPGGAHPGRPTGPSGTP